MSDFLDQHWRKISPEPNSGCWLWVGAIVTVTPKYLRPVIFKAGKPRTAARISFEMHNGTIPAGLLVCHRCDNSLCVNPDHLYAGTHQDNANDRACAGHHGAVRKTLPLPAGFSRKRCRKGHELTNPYVRPNGKWAECRECRRLESAGRRATAKI